MSHDPSQPPLDPLAQRFVQFVIMQAQQILYVLGTPTPDGEAVPPNLEAGKIFIDQLEMIRDKTKGNLSEQETQILDDTLSRVQLAFVQASGGTPASMMPSRDPGMGFDESAPEEEPPSPAAPPKEEPAPPAPAPEAPAAAAPSEPKPDTSDKPDDDEPDNKKRFVKSYG